MKKNILFGLTTIVLTLALFTSCTKIPQKEIDTATSAIEEAKMAGAEIYQYEKYISLQDSMRSVMVKIENKKSKFLKNYFSEKKQLEEVLNLAQSVKQQTEIKKEEIKYEIQNTISQVNSLIEANKKLITEAPKGKEGTSALQAMKSELSIIEAALTDAEAKFKDGEYLSTLDIVKASKEKASSINTELNEVITKYKSNQKGKKG